MDRCLKVRWALSNVHNESLIITIAYLVVQSDESNELVVLPILSFPAFCPWIATTRVGVKESEPEV